MNMVKGKPRKLQNIFNTVIYLGYYSEDCPYMCHALENAYSDDGITAAELRKTKRSIRLYLGEYIALSSVLRVNNHPELFYDRVNIYLNWSKRPKCPRKTRLL